MKCIFGFILFLLAVSFTKNELFTQTGNASYYGAKLHGRRTASGEVYHKDSLVCAHKTLKFGTLLRITNTSNDSVIVVRVIDRMGKSSPHIIDLSSGAAKRLGFLGKGIAKVKVEQLYVEPKLQVPALKDSIR
jgi:rare lipoprotein A